MRQLFVPACLCFVTLSSTTGFDLPLKTTAGSSSFDKNVVLRERPAGDDARGDAGADQTGSADAAPPPDAPAIAPDRIPLPPVPKPIVNRSRAEICDTLAQSAHSNNLPVPFFIRLLFQESGFRPGEVSSAGAEGIAQFMPETSASEGLHNPFDPLEAIPASARFLRKLLAQFGNLGLAAAAYNAGPRRIQDWIDSKGKGKLPQETEGYVRSVTGRPAETWRVASAAGTALSVPPDAPCKEMVPPPPKPQIVMAANKAGARAHDRKANVAAAAKPTRIAAARQKPPIQQLAARRHKAARKNQTVAQN